MKESEKMDMDIGMKWKHISCGTVELSCQEIWHIHHDAEYWELYSD